jgi:hypothetical protein
MTIKSSPLYRPAALLGFVLFSLLLAAGPAAARTESATAAQLLFSVARNLDAAVLDLNMLLGEDQSPDYSERLDATLGRLGDAATALAEPLASVGMAEQAKAIQQHVTQFSRLARTNRDRTLSSGAPEGAVLDEMMMNRKDARKLIDTAYAKLEKDAGVTGTPLAEARALALTLEQASALYVESAASAGGVSYRTLDSSEPTIDALAQRFSARLQQLTAQAKGDEATSLVRRIRSKWSFIEKSLLNYRDNTVPFLVDQYTQVIVRDLLALADVLERNP